MYPQLDYAFTVCDPVIKSNIAKIGSAQRLEIIITSQGHSGDFPGIHTWANIPDSDQNALVLISDFNFAVGWLVVLLFYVHGKHLRSCRDGQLT